MLNKGFFSENDIYFPKHSVSEIKYFYLCSMISLARHIELLLLEHDCVIAPGLGGFIANHAPARYNDSCDNLFLPPYRSVCFNQHLQTNDGLLVQAYMSAYDASYPDAYKQMNLDIEDVLNALDINGTFELPGIGILNKGINGNITFTAFDSGILTPALYGLYSFCIKSKEEAAKDKQIKQALQATNVLPIQTEHNNDNIVTAETIVATEQKADNPKTTTDKAKKTRNYSKFVDVAVACAASVLLFFIFSYPTHHSTHESETCIASPVSITAKEITQKPSATPSEVAPKQETITPVTSEQPVATPIEDSDRVQNDEPQATTITENNVNEYVIVLASGVMETNANYLIETLTKAGLPHAKFVKGGKMNRVVYSSYPTFEEATNELKQLRQESSYFKEAWVHKNKQ